MHLLWQQVHCAHHHVAVEHWPDVMKIGLATVRHHQQIADGNGTPEALAVSQRDPFGAQLIALERGNVQFVGECGQEGQRQESVHQAGLVENVAIEDFLKSAEFTYRILMHSSDCLL